MIKNAFAYVTRKSLKSLIIMLVILSMSILSFISLSLKDATDRASKETLANITNSFSMEINRQVNPGTPRGGGNVKGEDIKKISQTDSIDSYVKRINSVADLVDYDIIETQETLANQSPERAKNFKRTVMLTGVNDSSKETKFVSEAYKLVEGKHLENEDKNKILMHKDLAEKNNLKVGDKIKIKSNLFDADNEKGADETVEVEIKGLFDGHNSGGVSAAQELYENTLITDVHTAAKVYGNTEDTAVYQDATFFVKGDKNLDSVIKDLGKLDINWRAYNLIKSSSNYPALQQSISGIYSISNKLFVGSLIFAGVVVSLLLFLWMNARKKEIAVLLSLGISKLEIFGQFLIEMVFISIPAFVGSYFLAQYTADKLGNNILNKVTGDIAKQIARQSASSQLGGGAEAEGFNKTLSSLDINVLPKYLDIAVSEEEGRADYLTLSTNFIIDKINKIDDERLYCSDDYESLSSLTMQIIDELSSYAGNNEVQEINNIVIEDVEEKVMEIIKQIGEKDCAIDCLKNESLFGEKIKMRARDMLVVFFELEKQFDICFTEDDIKDYTFVSIEKISACIKKHLNK